MKILLVDDEEQILRGVTRLIECEEDEWEVETAISGEAAIEMLEEDGFDVIVSDMRMPGIDGAELLEHVAESYPAMLRIVLSGQADRDTVLRAVQPMHQYLSKPCDPEQLFAAIECAEAFQRTIRSPALLSAIGAANCLPPLPATVQQVNEATSNEGGDPRTIASIVAKDSVLSARILQLANSAIYALKNPVVDLDKAVSLVGNEMIRSLAMSNAIQSESVSPEVAAAEEQIFRHGFEVGVVGKRIAKHLELSADASNVVFTAGLLHDIGKLILLHAFTDEYLAMLEASQGSEESLRELESEKYGGTHEGVAAYLFSQWALPAEVIDAVAAHHSLDLCARDEQHPRRFVFAADWIVNERPVSDLEEKIAGHSDDGDVAAMNQFAQDISNWNTFIQSEESEV